MQAASVLCVVMRVLYIFLAYFSAFLYPFLFSYLQNGSQRYVEISEYFLTDGPSKKFLALNAILIYPHCSNIKFFIFFICFLLDNLCNRTYNSDLEALQIKVLIRLKKLRKISVRKVPDNDRS
jgi:hypothetical protein